MYKRRIKTSKDVNDKTLPIKDERQLRDLLNYFLSNYNSATTDNQRYLADRNWLFVYICVNTAFRAEDVLNLVPNDFAGGYMHIRENKTGKTQNYRLNKEVYSQITAYTERNNIGSHSYLFKSNRKDGAILAISRQQAWRMLKQAAKQVGIRYKFGIHSLRKTYGYMYIKKGGNVLTLMKMYNHDSPDITLLYVMWDSNDVEQERNKIVNGTGFKIKN